jgi:hypothetical protein
MSRTYLARVEVTSPALADSRKDLALLNLALDEWELAPDAIASQLTGHAVFVSMTELVVGASEVDAAAEYAADAQKLLGQGTAVEVTLKHLDMTKTPLDMGPGNTYQFPDVKE